MSAVITASGQPDEGQSYSLTCEVRGDERLAVSSSTLRWDKDGREYSRNPTLTFNPLRRDDAGEYRCTSTFSSPYLTGSRTVTQTRTLTVNRKKIQYDQIATFNAHQITGVSPGPVNNLRVTTPTATTLPLTWTVSGFPDRFEVTYSYTVKRCSAPQGAPRTDTISDGSVRSHTLRNLNEDSSYTITVRAINTAGSTMATITADTLTSSWFLNRVCMRRVGIVT